MVFCDLWCYYYNVLGCHKPHPRKMENSINKCCWPFHRLAVPISLSPPSVCVCVSLSVSLLLSPPFGLPLTHNNIDIGTIDNPPMASKCSSERKSSVSHTLNQTLEILSLVSKACESWDKPKARHLAPVSQLVTAKEKSLKEIKTVTPVSTWMIRK